MAVGSVTRAWLMVAVAVIGISSSAPITAATVAPVLAVAFWRNLVGAAVSGAWVGARERDGPALLSARAGWLAALAGMLLAVHFVTWFSGLRLTSVTASTALVCTTPVWTVAFDLLRRVAVPRAVLIGVLLAMVGVAAITGVDAARSSDALLGDLLSVVGAITAAGYVVVGDRVLRTASTAVYTLLAYGVCAALLLPVCLVTGTQLVGFSERTWIQLAIVTIGAQLLGHTLLNAALPRIGVTPVALAILLEVPGATLVAWAWLGRVPPLSVLPGTLLMLLGLVIVVRSRRAPALPVD
ncbi:MAG TPA: DMT family transporter [Kineosporiaceae bacterium]|nr:DMT family transporter [Kineosporiaceae bacterium]